MLISLSLLSPVVLVQAAPPPQLSDEKRMAIVKQVEFYFSDENLSTDKFMKQKLRAGGPQGESRWAGAMSPALVLGEHGLGCNHSPSPQTFDGDVVASRVAPRCLSH